MDANFPNPMPPMSPIPGFLVQIWTFDHQHEAWVIEGNGSEVYRVRLRKREVVNACNSLIFCYDVEGDEHVFSIENPATRTSTRLPRPDEYDWLFNAMAFDASSRRATVVVGTNNYARIGKDYMNIMEMEIYDSDSNAWSSISMTVPEIINPMDRGIYSRGKFYWLTSGSRTSHRVVAFTVADRLWEVIPLPEGVTRAIPDLEYSPRLSGCDGRLVIICEKGDRDIYLWKLNENNGHEWCEVRVDLPKVQDPIRPVGGSFDSVYVAVNSSGWTMVMDRTFQALIFNDDGKLVRSVRLPRPQEHQAIDEIGSFSYISVFPFESNNIWWPK
jgi:F-box interacting protein